MDESVGNDGGGRNRAGSSKGFERIPFRQTHATGFKYARWMACYNVAETDSTDGGSSLSASSHF